MRSTSLLILGALVALAGCSADTPGSGSEGLFTEKTCMAYTTAIECEGKIGSNLAVSNDATAVHMINDAETGFRIAAENIYIGTAPAPTLPSGEFDTAAFPYKHDYGATPPESTEHHFPLADLGVGCGDTLQIAFHVIVVKLDAAGDPIGYKQGKVAFAYEICCEPEPEPDGGVPEPEPDAGMPDEADDGCTLTQGYWKNHPQDFPVMSLDIAGETYDTEDILEIFGMQVRGDQSISLAHQLFAAMLNVEAGATEPDAIDDAIDFIGSTRGLDADGDGRLPYGFEGGTDEHRTASELSDRLTAFNEGRTGPGHCDDD